MTWMGLVGERPRPGSYPSSRLSLIAALLRIYHDSCLVSGRIRPEKRCQFVAVTTREAADSNRETQSPRSDSPFA